MRRPITLKNQQKIGSILAWLTATAADAAGGNAMVTPWRAWLGDMLIEPVNALLCSYGMPWHAHAQGRAPSGHLTAPEQVAALAGVREQFEQAALYEDD